MRCPTRYAILEPSADLRERQRERLQRSLTPPLFELRRVARRPVRRRLGRRAVRQRGDRRAADAALRAARRRGLRGVRRARRATDFVRVRSSGRRAAAAAVRHVERKLRARRSRTATAPRLLPQLPYWLQAVIGGLRSRRDAVRRLRSSAPRVLPARTQRRHAARVLSPSHGRRRARAWPGLQDLTASVDFTALAEAGTARRLRLRRLLLAGQLPARQRARASALAAHRSACADEAERYAATPARSSS